jgi:hypothetical protein
MRPGDSRKNSRLPEGIDTGCDTLDVAAVWELCLRHAVERASTGMGWRFKRYAA